MSARDGASTSRAGGGRGEREEPEGAGAGEEEERDERVSYIGAGLRSLAELPGYPVALARVTSLCVHGNNVSSLEGVAGLGALTDLNLSSNLLTSTRALAALTRLTKLNLASNQLAEVEGLAGLPSLTSLVLAHNYIASLASLLPQPGGLQQLTTLDLRNNRLEAPQELSYVAGCGLLTALRLSGNPLAYMPDYRQAVGAALPRIATLDEQQLVRSSPSQQHLLLPGGVYMEPSFASLLQATPPPPPRAWRPAAPQPAPPFPPPAPSPPPRPAAPASPPPPQLQAQAQGGRMGRYPVWPKPLYAPIPQTGSPPPAASPPPPPPRDPPTPAPAPARAPPPRATPRIDTAMAGFRRKRGGGGGAGAGAGRGRACAGPPRQQADAEAIVPRPEVGALESRLEALERRMQGVAGTGRTGPHSDSAVRPPSMSAAPPGHSSAVADATCQTVQVGSQVERLEAEAARLRTDLQGLAERLAAEGRETEERARAAEAEAAGQLFAMRRELDDAVGWREEAEARAAAAEDAESEALNRAAEMEDEVARCAEQLLERESELAELRRSREARDAEAAEQLRAAEAGGAARAAALE
eukprot:jgi/Tetstr1/427628/TSEL_017753.t1